MSKVQLQGNVSGTGVFTIASPNSNTDRTLTLPDSSGTIGLSGAAVARSQLPTGSILQVVQGSDTTARSTSSNYPVDSGWTASITPTSATSRILVLVNWQAYVTSGTDPNKIGVFGIWRGGNQLTHTRMSAAPGPNNWSDLFVPTCLQIIDSPATTSSVTYTMRWGRFNSTFNNNLAMNDSTATGGQMICTVMLLEIAS
jgi:hypothetical protein